MICTFLLNPAYFAGMGKCCLTNEAVPLALVPVHRLPNPSPPECRVPDGLMGYGLHLLKVASYSVVHELLSRVYCWLEGRFKRMRLRVVG